MKINPKKDKNAATKLETSKTRIYLMRHGEPEIYGDRNSSLNLQGKKQIDRKVSFYLKLLELDKKHKVQILYSDRKRARESGLLLDKKMRSVIAKNKVKNIKILKTKHEKKLQTADPINSLVMLGHPIKTAYKKWMDYPEKDLISLGIITPEEMRKNFINSFAIIGITHETTLLAFQRKLFPELIRRPSFAEIMQVQIKSNNVLEFNYRGRKKEIYAKI